MDAPRHSGAPESEATMREPDPTPMKNLTGGGGCGCGCVGLLIALLGVFALLTIPLGFYPDAASGPVMQGIALIVGGLVVFALGAAVYVGSLFID
ncbi:MAG: hypothetical protein R3F59_38695 [Myxococcota bacterium]